MFRPSVRALVPRPVLLALWALAACATVHPAPPPPLLELPPETIEARRADLDLADKNDEELFAAGMAAYEAGDPARAASAFDRIVESFPSSRRYATALFDAGLAQLKLAAWPIALERFQRFAREHTGPDADDAAFKAAECLYRLHELPQARAALDRLAARTDLPPVDRIRAFTQRGVVELESGDAEQAERSLQIALSLWSQAKEEERIDEQAPAKAHFWLGEVQRQRFRAIALDFSGSGGKERCAGAGPGACDAALAEALEAKSSLLLLAQSQYLQAARRGAGDFGVAGVARVGELYEELYQRMAEAPVPADLDAEESAAWREALWKELRVLVTKAVQAYEGALVAARSRGVDPGIVESAERSLERMKGLLLAADAGQPGALPGGTGR